ncbi:MAG: PSD1 domain-containing protein [Planctomycetales bacterium]|nr:PSD1 domain-containing protein [Planctomycetales bacterium]
MSSIRQRKEFRRFVDGILLSRTLRVTMSLAVLIGGTAIAVAEDGAVDAAEVVFDQSIAPILVEHCLTCHSGAEPKGNLDLSGQLAANRGGDTGSAIVAGAPGESLLWQRIESGDMPPKSQLSSDQQNLIRHWIQGGAVWGTDPINIYQHTTSSRAGYDWWSLQPVQRPAIPRDNRAKSAVDAFVLQRLDGVGLTMSPRAAAREIVRRLSIDLLGIPPTPGTVQEFEQQFSLDSDRAIESLIDQLLTSPQYGQRWARHWLDVARFGESQGFERDKLRDNSWYYRDWVIDALNRDLPYDEFVRMQIAGDVIRPDDVDSVIATGFMVAGAWDEVGQSQQSDAMKQVVRQDELEDYIGTVGQAFLGLTVNCARCHDHKFDPISQKEYYRISATLAGVRHGSRDLISGNQQKINVYAVVPRQPEETFLLGRGNPNQKIEQVSPGGVASIKGVDGEFGLDESASDADRRQSLANWITDRQNPLFARVIVNRLWHYHFGSGLVDSPNDFGFSGGVPSHPELLDYLASELIDSGFRLKHIHRLIVSSETYLQSSRYRKECAAVDSGNQLFWRKDPMRLDAETLRDTVLTVAGQMNSQYGGPSYQDFETHVHNSQFYEMVDRDSPEVYRRTIYRSWIRSGRSHLLDVFDCPDPSTTAPKRSVTTTPLQALTLMNNSFVIRMADRLATRVVHESGNRTADQVTRVYLLAYGRNPDQLELAAAVGFVGAHGLSALCRVIFNSNEFIHVD